MMRRRGVVVTGLLVCAPGVAAATQTVSSQIDAVTVYPGNAAGIERSADLAASEQPREVRLGPLPAGIVDDSIGVEVRDEVHLGSVELERRPVGEAPRERERALRDELERLQRNRQAALDGEQVADLQLDFLKNLAKMPTREEAPAAFVGDGDVSSWSDIWQVIGRGSEKALERKRSQAAKAEDLKGEIETVQDKIAQLGSDRREAVYVTIRYGGADGPSTLRVSYRVRGPQWSPRYRMRLDTQAGQIELVHEATVRQATGEEWRDVQLRLSTVAPVRGQRPEPSPLWVDLAPERRAKSKGGEEAAMALSAADSAGERARKRGARTRNAEFAATYVVDGRVSVAAGNEPRTFAIGTHTLEAEVGVEVFAQRSERAWLTARAQWEGQGPLPSGQVSRYRDGAYVGRGRLAGWAPGAKRTLSFGHDPRIEVAFDPLRKTSGEAGWLSTSSKEARMYRLRVTNRHQRSIPVTSLFRVPVPRNEAITVERQFSQAPSTEDVDGTQGLHAWRSEIAAGASQQYELGYTVSYPSERELEGLR